MLYYYIVNYAVLSDSVSNPRSNPQNLSLNYVFNIVSTNHHCNVCAIKMFKARFYSSAFSKPAISSHTHTNHGNKMCLSVRNVFKYPRSYCRRLIFLLHTFYKRYNALLRFIVHMRIKYLNIKKYSPRT